MFKKNSKLTTILIVSAVLIVAVSAFAMGKNSTQQENTVPGELSIDQPYHDFGTVGLDEVSHTYDIQNTGQGALTISKVSTSCGCTTAQLIKGGRTSISFGMDHGNLPKANLTLQPDEKAQVVVTYDPLAHGLANAAGRFRRVVYIRTDNPDEEHQLRLSVTVDPELSDE